MKFFALAAAFLAIATSSQPIDCGEGRVPSVHNFCISPDYIEGCLTYSSEISCAKCEVGYDINTNGTCDAHSLFERQIKIQGCLSRDMTNQNKCINCANGTKFLTKGYILKSGICEKGTKNCLKYENNQCKQCIKNYSLILNQCHLNPILGCRKYTPSHICQQCQYPFQLNNNHTCSIENCKNYNDYGCITCQCGYYLEYNRTCKKYQQGCIRYQRGKCINCLAYYRLKGNVCQIQGCLKYRQTSCEQCKPGYDINGDGCVFKNCLDWANGQCLSCKQGFKNQGGTCIKQQPQYCEP